MTAASVAAVPADSPPATVVALPDWGERNRQWLLHAFELLAPRIAGGEAVECVVEPTGFVPALVHVGRMFGLSSFERELLLLAAGMELDHGVRSAVVAIDPHGPTFALALGWLDRPHWDALSPSAPLRAWRMLTLDPGGLVTDATLRIDERLLHFLAGVVATDTALAGVAAMMHPVAGEGEPPLVRQVAAAFDSPGEAGAVVLLDGQAHDPRARRDVALAVAAGLGRPVLWIGAGDVPADPVAVQALAIHCDREAALTGALPVIAVEGDESGAAVGLAARMRADLLWLGAWAAGLAEARRLVRFALPAPDPATVGDALARRWRRGAVPTAADNPAILAAFGRAARQFRLGPSSLDGVIGQVRTAADPVAAVWPAARAAVRHGLERIATRVETGVTLADLVLPPGQQALIRDIVAQLGQGERVYRDWGLGATTPRGQGLVALFTGESGTGKTLAAEAIANAVDLDLYRVDLAATVSKYIGETEKNLKRLFDAAEASGAVLLFDEADALFGKRSEVKDSHDRYANIEIAYLLQRVEAYRGLAILTTNLKSAIDRAFLRRIRFVVPFPVPDAAAREAIWRRQFPAAAPLGEVDFAVLARLALVGGHIRSIAVNAAFKAAQAGGCIEQATLVAAAREELAKLERSAAGLGGAA